MDSIATVYTILDMNEENKKIEDVVEDPYLDYLKKITIMVFEIREN